MLRCSRPNLLKVFQSSSISSLQCLEKTFLICQNSDYCYSTDASPPKGNVEAILAARSSQRSMDNKERLVNLFKEMYGKDFLDEYANKGWFIKNAVPTNANSMRTQLKNLNALFGQGNVLKVIKNCPNVLTKEPYTTKMHIEAMAGLYKFTVDEMKEHVVRNPILLYSAVEAHARQIERLQQLLEVDREEAVKHIMSSRSAVGCRSYTLLKTVYGLHEALNGMVSFNPREMLRKKASLLSQSAETTISKWKQLLTLLGCHQPWLDHLPQLSAVNVTTIIDSSARKYMRLEWMVETGNIPKDILFTTILFYSYEDFDKRFPSYQEWLKHKTPVEEPEEQNLEDEAGDDDADEGFQMEWNDDVNEKVDSAKIKQ